MWIITWQHTWVSHGQNGKEKQTNPLLELNTSTPFIGNQITGRISEKSQFNWATPSLHLVENCGIRHQRGYIFFSSSHGKFTKTPIAQSGRLNDQINFAYIFGLIPQFRPQNLPQTLEFAKGWKWWRGWCYVSAGTLGKHLRKGLGCQGGRLFDWKVVTFSSPHPRPSGGPGAGTELVAKGQWFNQSSLCNAVSTET